MIHLSPHAHGVVLLVKARPGAKQNALTGEHDGHLKVSVCQAPEHGKANRAVAEVLCKSLGLRAAQLELLSGETSPTKRFMVRDVTLAELADRVTAAIAEPATKKKR